LLPPVGIILLIILADKISFTTDGAPVNALI